MKERKVEKSEYDHIVELYIEGASYAAIGRQYEVGRERIRQIIAKHDPEASKKREGKKVVRRKRRTEVRSDFREEQFLARLQEVIDNDIKCAACGGWVIRDIATKGDYRTCSPECASAWGVLRSFPEVAGDDHRLHMANSILRNVDNYSDAEVDWAQRMIEDAPPPNRRWVTKGSKRAAILKEFRPEIYEKLVK